MLQPLSEYLFTGRFALAVGLGGFVTCIISIPAPLFKRGGHFVALCLHFVADGGKNGQQGEDLLEVEPLVCRVRGM